MTETRTARFQLAQWSAGTDSPNRTDFNDSFANLAALAAYDDGQDHNGLPAGIPGGYVWLVDPTYGASLFRGDQQGVYRYIGGGLAPVPLTLRRIVGQGGAASDDALALSVRDPGGQPNASIDYNGRGRFSNVVVAPAAGDVTPLPSDGVLHVNASQAPVAANTGRLLVRQTGTDDRGVVVQTMTDGAPALAVRDSGGSYPLSVSAAGRLTAGQPSAFGRAPTATGTALTVAALATPGNVGLALAGSGLAGDTATSLLRATRGGTDTAPLLDVRGTDITVGRPDGGVYPTDWSEGGVQGVVTVGGRVVRSVAGIGEWMPAVSDVTATVPRRARWSAAGLDSTLPGAFSQQAAVDGTVPALRLRNYAGATGTALAVSSSVAGQPDVVTLEAFASGQVLGNVPWLGTGARPLARRDMRLPVKHRQSKVYATNGSALELKPSTNEDGLQINVSQSYTEVFKPMKVRALGTIDVELSLDLEMVMRTAGWIATPLDAQTVRIETEMTTNGGGSWVSVGASEVHPIAVGLAILDFGLRHAGDNGSIVHYKVGAATAGQVMQFRARFINGNSYVNALLRSVTLRIEECVIDTEVIG